MNLTPFLLYPFLLQRRCFILAFIGFLISTSANNKSNFFTVLCYTTLDVDQLATTEKRDAPTTTDHLSTEQDIESSSTNFWRDAGRLTGFILNKCLENLDSQSNLMNINGDDEKGLHRLLDCLKRRSLVLLDRTMNRNVVELGNGLALVRVNRTNNDIADYPVSGNRKSFNGQQMVKNWKMYVLGKIVDIFRTHTLQIKLGKFFNDNNIATNATSETTMGRHRRHKNMMMPLMVFGMMALGMIMIPMGFQFLAVLGGKALLLAKMALLLTSIQGLKKIATSNLNYGLYSTTGHAAVPPPSAAAYPWHYDRKWPIDLWGHGLGAGAAGVAAVGEGQDFQSSQYNYYDVVGANSRPDLLHPYQPRTTTNDDAFFQHQFHQRQQGNY